MRKKKQAPERERERERTDAAAVADDAMGAIAFGADAAVALGTAVRPGLVPVPGSEFGSSSGAPVGAVAGGGGPNCFFTGSNPSALGDLGSIGAASTMGSLPFNFSGCCGVGGGLMHPPSVRPQAWDTNPRPHNGFMSLLHNQPQQPHQRTPVTPTANQTSENHETVNLDSGDEDVRTDKRILWTPEEDERLMSAWVNNSMDSISGNEKKNEQYWADVTRTYNLTTPKQRKTNMKQAKDHWHKINKSTDLFHSAWLKSQLIYSSGHSEQDWINKAHKFYLADNIELKLGPFMLMDVWYVVRNEPKWVTYNKGLKKAPKRKESGNEEASDSIDDPERPLPRPIGTKKAKKLLYEGKSRKSAIDVDELNKFDKFSLMLMKIASRFWKYNKSYQQRR